MNHDSCTMYLCVLLRIFCTFNHTRESGIIQGQIHLWSELLSDPGTYLLIVEVTGVSTGTCHSDIKCVDLLAEIMMIARNRLIIACIQGWVRVWVIPVPVLEYGLFCRTRTHTRTHWKINPITRTRTRTHKWKVMGTWGWTRVQDGDQKSI